MSGVHEDDLATFLSGGGAWAGGRTGAGSCRASGDVSAPRAPSCGNRRRSLQGEQAPADGEVASHADMIMRV
eukprot:366465-Chlamydomonas_euryale.AAC.5